MASKTQIKGITIEIGGDTSKLTKSLSGVNEEINSTQRELKEVEKRLKLDPGNTELLAQKQAILNENIQATDKKLSALKSAKEKADTAMANGTEINTKMYRRLQREIYDATISIEEMTVDVKDLGDESNKTGNDLDNMGIATKNVNANVLTAKASVASFAFDIAKTLVSAMSNLVAETREYREEMNKLDTAYSSAGHSVESAKKIYNEFYKILGETDRSVEAVNHLAKFVKEEKELTKWGNIAAGVTATFGDSLPIEGLTEAANETAKVGKVTGVLADALNWAGVNEDKFNEELEKCNDEQERAAKITDTLNELYITSAESYKEMNADIMASREATEKLSEAKAKFGAILEPVLNGAKNLTADVALGVVDWVEKMQGANDEVKILGESVQQLDEKQNTYKENLEKSVVAELAEIERCKLLYNELQNLVDQSGAVQEADKTRAEYIIGELNEALGLEIEMNGNVVNSLDSYSQKIDEIIAKKQAQILLDSQEEAYADAFLNRNKAADKQQEIYDMLIAKKTELAEKEAAYNEAMRQGNEALAIEISMQKYAINDEIDSLEKSLDEAGEIVERYDKTMETYKLSAEAAAEGNVQKMLEIMDGENEARKESSEVALATEKDKVGKQGEILAAAVRQYELAAERCQKVNSDANQEEKARAEQYAIEMAEAYKAVGGQIVDGQVVGMDGKKVTLFNKAEELVAGLKEKFTGIFGFDIHSPSKWAKKIMEWVDIGLAEGIEENTSAEEAMEKKVKNLKNKISELKGEADIDSKISDAELELWKLANPDATEEEVFTREAGNLMTAIKNQTEKIDLVNVSYEEMKKLTGENSEESKSLQLELTNERIELEKLNDEMAELIENRKKANGASGSTATGSSGVSPSQSVADYYNYIAKYGGELSKQGLSEDAIKNAAASMTGYSAPSYNTDNTSNVSNKSVVINQTINNPTAESAYGVKKMTLQALKQFELSGGL